MSMKKYKMTVDPKTIGDMELEWLSDKEREARWNKVRKIIKENEQPYEITIEVEYNPILDREKEINATTSYNMFIWDTTEDN